jgi:hypothetical protein
MGVALTAISPELEAFIKAQPVFFVATAPIDGGHINVSPKGLDTLRILSPTRAAYLDLTGSGNETAAHVTQNGRLTIMFCAFAGRPRIVRLYGRGAVVLPGDSGWPVLSPAFPASPGVRQIITMDIVRVASSCGFGVPRMVFEGERPDMQEWAERKGVAGLEEFRAKHNRASIDGLPAPGRS